MTISPRSLRRATLACLAIGLVVTTFSDSAEAQTLRRRKRPKAPELFVRHVWPLLGMDSRDWVINNYVDLDSTTGLKDYMGNTGAAAKTYDGHKGIDIDIASFRKMEENVPIVATYKGTVTEVDDSNCDRNTSCSGTWNHITILHDDGYQTIYGHLKTGSAQVVVGQRVSIGEVIAYVGSSGCSTQPHLHYQVQDPNNQVVEPFLLDWWLDAPVYDTQLGLMELVVDDQPITSAYMKSPGPNVQWVYLYDQPGFGVHTGGGQPGDTIDLTLRDPQANVFKTKNFTFTFATRDSWSIWNETLDSQIGNWSLEVRLNGVLKGIYPFQQRATTPASFQGVSFEVTAADFNTTFNGWVNQGYRPVIIDGFDVFGTTYYNLVFEKRSGGAWHSFVDKTKSEVETLIADYGDCEGYRLIHLDQYLVSGSERFAGVFLQEGASDWEAVLSQGNSTYQTTFNDLAAQGYRNVMTSATALTGWSPTFSGLFDKKNVGSWSTWWGMDNTSYESTNTSELSAGKSLGWVSGYMNNGLLSFAANWDAATFDADAYVHKEKLADLIAIDQANRAAGLRLVAISGFDNGIGAKRYTARWKR